MHFLCFSDFFPAVWREHELDEPDCRGGGVEQCSWFVLLVVGKRSFLIGSFVKRVNMYQINCGILCFKTSVLF